MPKVTKKKSKTSKKTTPTTETIEVAAPVVPVVKKEESPRPLVPYVDPGVITFGITEEDLRTLANLMSLTASTYEQMALEAVQANDNDGYTVFQTRAKVSAEFAAKFVSMYKMPEPISRDIH